jgi:hypothetical protein
LWTTASGKQSHAAGRNATATNDNTYVWSDGTETFSTTNKQFTVYAENGIRLLGGPISGDGSGLTNLNVVAEESDPVWSAEKSDYLTTTDADSRYLQESGGTVSGDLTVQGSFVAMYIPPQGDLSMGSYTNGVSY